MEGDRARDVANFMRQCAASLAEQGYHCVPLPVIQPADAYLDLIGENARPRLVTFVAPGGEEMCLRSDLTIPLARHRLAEIAMQPETTAEVARLWAQGAVFRYPSETSTAGGVNEVHHIDVELMHETDSVAADCEVLVLTCTLMELAGIGSMPIRTGDIALFGDFVAALGLSPMLTALVLRCFHHPQRLEPLIAPSTRTKTIRAASIADDLKGPIEELLGLTESHPIGTRSTEEIRERFLRTRLTDMHDYLDPDRGALIREFLALRSSLAAAPEAAAALYRRGGIKTGPGWERFARRVSLLLDGRCSHHKINFEACFGREMGYYTGFVFEVATDQRLAGGGRYDRMLQDLGAHTAVPAVGCALWYERLLAAAG